MKQAALCQVAATIGVLSTFRAPFETPNENPFFKDSAPNNVASRGVSYFSARLLGASHLLRSRHRRRKHSFSRLTFTPTRSLSSSSSAITFKILTTALLNALHSKSFEPIKSRFWPQSLSGSSSCSELLRPAFLRAAWALNPIASKSRLIVARLASMP